MNVEQTRLTNIQWLIDNFERLTFCEKKYFLKKLTNDNYENSIIEKYLDCKIDEINFLKELKNWEAYYQMIIWN